MPPSTSAIAIPTRSTRKHTHAHRRNTGSLSSSADADASSKSWAGAAGSYESVREGDGARELRGERRPSFMSPAFAKAEHTVVNVGNADMPRLITCVKTSQGFDWNQEIFLPSYANVAFDDLERKQDPVQDIIVTDEEIKGMFPE